MEILHILLDSIILLDKTTDGISSESSIFFNTMHSADRLW